MIDLLAHYDAVAELMAAMGGWLENGAGSFNGLVVSYVGKFTKEKEEREWVCERANPEERLVRVQGLKCDQQQTSGVADLNHVTLTHSLKAMRFMGGLKALHVMSTIGNIKLPNTALIKQA